MDAKNKKNQEEPTENKSKLFIKSMGYAAANLELNSKLLEVYPVEEFGYTDGEITDERETIEETGIDSKGNTYSSKIETSNSLVAEWMPLGSNRFSAPNVRRGERVILLQYADDDKYYWVTLGMDDHLRRRETLIFNLSNTVDESTKEINSTNSYSVIFSTHTKELTVQTTKTDGEEFAYILKLDVKNGLFVITDDINNQISLESKEKRITLVNASGSSVVLDKKNIKLDAIETLDLNAKNVNINATNLTTNSTTHSVTATTHNITAATGGLNVGKYSMGGGSIDMGGSGLIVGTGSQFNGTIMNNGVNIGSTHSHRGVKSGGDTSGAPT